MVLGVSPPLPYRYRTTRLTVYQKQAIPLVVSALKPTDMHDGTLDSPDRLDHIKDTTQNESRGEKRKYFSSIAFEEGSRAKVFVQTNSDAWDKHQTASIDPEGQFKDRSNLKKHFGVLRKNLTSGLEKSGHDDPQVDKSIIDWILEGEGAIW